MKYWVGPVLQRVALGLTVDGHEVLLAGDWIVLRLVEVIGSSPSVDNGGRVEDGVVPFSYPFLGSFKLSFGIRLTICRLDFLRRICCRPMNLILVLHCHYLLYILQDFCLAG